MAVLYSLQDTAARTDSGRSEAQRGNADDDDCDSDYDGRHVAPNVIYFK